MANKLFSLWQNSRLGRLRLSLINMWYMYFFHYIKAWYEKLNQNVRMCTLKTVIPFTYINHWNHAMTPFENLYRICESRSPTTVALHCPIAAGRPHFQHWPDHCSLSMSFFLLDRKLWTSKSDTLSPNSLRVEKLAAQDSSSLSRTQSLIKIAQLLADRQITSFFKIFRIAQVSCSKWFSKSKKRPDIPPKNIHTFATWQRSVLLFNLLVDY